MKIISFILCILISCVAFAQNSQNDEPIFQGNIHVYGDMYKYTGVIKGSTDLVTTAAITMYVRTDGNDNNTCTVNSAAGACLTVQGAVNKIPKRLAHAVIVNIGAGTFGGFTVAGFTADVGGSFQMIGTLGTPTLAGGSASGTATGGTTAQCIDGGQTWVNNALVGMYALVAGEYRIIRSNNGTTLELVGELTATCSGKAYSIVEHKTVVSTNGSVGYANIEFTNNRQRAYSSFKFQDIKGTSVTMMGVWAGYSCAPNLIRIQALGTGYMGMYMQELTGQVYLEDISAINCADIGIFIRGNDVVIRTSYRLFASGNLGAGVIFTSLGAISVVYDIFADNNNSDGLMVWYSNGPEIHHVVSTNNGGDGVEFLGTFNVDGDDEAWTITDNSGNGIRIDYDEYQSSVTIGGGSVISNNGLDGIYIGQGSTLYTGTAITGTGNGRYGVNVQPNGFMRSNTGVTITGGYGDATVNNGGVVLVWATDFPGNDTVTNAQTGAKIISVVSL